MAYRLPPRQKMINLLYVILIAILAISISVEVLEGFNTVSKDLQDNIQALKEYNGTLEQKLNNSGKSAEVQATAPVKKQLQEFNELRNELKQKMYDMVMKRSISDKVEMNDDQNAVKTVMLEEGNATELKNRMDNFRESCLKLVKDENARILIESLLSTDTYSNDKTWEQEHFENLPYAGSMMVMNNMEKDMWIALNEVMRNTDTAENAVNDQELTAETQNKEESKENEPEQSYGNDDFQKELIAQLKKQQKEWKEARNKVVTDENGQIKALIMMENSSPLFANFENKVNITIVPASQQKNIKVEMTGGKIYKEGNHYVAIPNGKSNKVKMTLKEGRNVLAAYEYDIMPLPTPRPLLLYTAQSGAQREYRSGVPLTRKEIQSISEIKLNMDEVDTKEAVTGFDLLLVKNGNKTVITEHADGNKLTPKMKKILENVVKGDKLYFNNITVKGKVSPERTTVSVSVIPM